jgi:serine/threonine-protein phosphatase 5
MKSGDFEDAVTSYTKSINLYDKEPAAFSNRALANLKLKKFSQTIEDSTKCLELDPKFVKAYHRRGKAYQSCGKYELAIKDYQKILEVEPENADINKSLHLCRQK